MDIIAGGPEEQRDLAGCEWSKPVIFQTGDDRFIRLRGTADNQSTVKIVEIRKPCGGVVTVKVNQCGGLELMSSLPADYKLRKYIDGSWVGNQGGLR